MADTVAVVSPLGGVQQVAPEEAEHLVASEGWRHAAPEEATADANQRKYGGLGGAAAAAGAGLLRGASLGGTDALGAAVGLDDELAGLRDANPGMSTLGEIGGGLLGVGEFGGPGLLARATRAVSAPARAALRVGEAVEGIAGTGLMGTALRGAAEGALFGAGSGVSELALSDDDVTGERLAMALGGGAMHGALYGGGIGLGAGIAGKALRGGGSMLERAILRPSAEGLEAAAASQFGHAAPGIGERLVRSLDPAVSVITGTERGTLASLATAEGRRIAMSAPKIRAAELEEFVGMLTKSREAEERIANQFQGGFKRNQISSIVRTGNEASTITAARETMTTLRSKIDDAVNLGVDTKFYGKLQSQLDTLEVRLNAAENLGLGTKGLNEDLFMDLDGLKRRIGRRAMGYADKGAHGLGEEQRASWNILKSMYEDTLRPTLESQNLWGQAGRAQSAINGPWKQLLDTKLGSGPTRGFESLFTTKTRDWQGAKWVVDRKKVAAFLDSITDPAEHEGLQVLNDWMDRSQGFVDIAKKHLALGEGELAAADGLEGTLNRLKSSRDKVVEAATLENQLKKLDEADSKSSFLASAAGYALGSGALGPAGAVGMGLLGALTKPGATLRKVAVAEQMLAGYGDKIAGGVRGLFRAATPVAVRAALPAARLAEDVRARREKFEKRETELRTALQQRDMTRQRFAGMFAPIAGDAPKATARAVDRFMVAAEYLHSHLPKRASDNYPLSMPRPPSRTDLDSWERRAAAVDDPVGTLAKELKRGRLAPETLDAVKTVWPQAYDDFAGEMFGQMVRMHEEGKSVPYKARVALGALVGEAADPLLAREMVTFMQSQYGAEPVTDEPVKSAAQVPDIASAFKTDAERIADDHRGS